VARDSGQRTDRLDRAYALVYGLGLGLIGDEVGLLLDVRKLLFRVTYQIFVGAVGLIILEPWLFDSGRDCEEISCEWSDGKEWPCRALF